MSFLGKNIPYISITSEEKNEENTKGRNTVGTDTDSDSSSSDHEVNERVSNKNNTLNTNNKKDDGATDVENLEESDDEDFLNNDETTEQDYSYDLDLHERSFVSNSSKQIGSVNIQYQSTVTSNYSDKLEIEKENVSGGVTDTEELNGSNDEAPEPITEINLSQILTDHMNTINIIDDVKSRDLTSMETQCGEDVPSKKGNKTKKAKKPTRKFQLLKKSNPYTNLIASPLSPQLSDITDTEIIYSDSDEDRDDKYKSSTSKKRRTRIISSKTKDILTDTEDIYLSDRDGRPKLKRELSLSKKPEFSGSHVLTVTNDNMDSETNSDTDDEIVSIVTLLPNKKPIKDAKKKISFPKMQLVVHNDESVGILTDVDDFEADDDVDEDVQNYDQQLESPNIPEQLLEMESFCTTVSEEMNTKNTPKFYITETFAVTKNQERKPIFYTIEDLEEEEMEFDTSDSESHTNEAVINDLGNGIVFYTNGHKIPKFYTGIKNTNLNSNLLSIQDTNDGGVTDTENLNSSDDDDMQKKVIPVAILQTNKIDSDTDSEVMDTEVDVEKSNVEVSEMPELELPKPVCEQITIKYDSDGHPKVTIEPITDQTSFGLYDSTLDDGKTDTEDMLFDENILEEDYKETNINIPIFDDDEQNNTVIVTNSEFKKNENQTDSSSKLNRKLKKSNKYNKPTNELTVESTAAVLTDREDIDVSDAEDLQESGIDVIKKSRAIARDINSVREIKTDTEDMGVSDDDLNELIDIKRALSATPDMMYLMAGNSTVSKEYDNNNMSFTEKSFIDFKDIPHIEMTSATPEIQPTDTEDVFTSADEEFTTTYSRAETATPIETKNPYDDITASQVHVQYIGKFDETEEILHIKGGCYYPDMYTDIEDLGMSDDELLYDEKQQDDPSKDKSKPNETHKTFITKYDSEEQSPARTASGPRELTDVTQQLPGEEIDIQDTAPTGEGWDQAQSSTVAQEDAAVSSARRVEIEEGVGSSTAFQTSQDQRDFPVNQQSLSEEMKELLKELEEQSHK